MFNDSNYFMKYKKYKTKYIKLKSKTLCNNFSNIATTNFEIKCSKK